MKYRKRASSIGCAFGEEAIERMLKLKFKKKPVVIDAIWWNGNNTEDVLKFTGDAAYESMGFKIMIHTLEGDLTADKGDWIIKGVKGEFYPCKPDIFKMSYERTYEEAYEEGRNK